MASGRGRFFPKAMGGRPSESSRPVCAVMAPRHAGGCARNLRPHRALAMVSTVTHQGLVCPDAGRVSFRPIFDIDIDIYISCLVLIRNL